MSNVTYSIGFEALCSGEDHLVARFCDWLNEHHPTDKLRQTGMSQFGFINYVSQKRNPLKATIRKGQVNACVKMGRLNPRIRVGSDIDAPVLRSSLPTVLGITIHSANMLLRKSGFDLRRGSGQLVGLPKGLVEDFRNEVAQSVPVSQAAQLLGCTETEANLVSIKLAKDGWNGCIQLRHAEGVIRHFVKADLEKLVETIRSLPTDFDGTSTVGLANHVVKDQVSETRLMADVLLGKQVAYANPDVPGLRGLRFPKRERSVWSKKDRIPVDEQAMTASEFFSLTGVPKGGAQYLILQGVLKPHPARGILRQSADAFHSQYINPVRYFHGQGSTTQAAAKFVESHRFKHAFPPEEIGSVMVTREHLVETIGELYQPPKRILDLWPAVVDSGVRNCPLLIIPEAPGSGSFDIGPSSRLLSVKATLQDDGIRIDIAIKPSYQRMWKIVADNEPEILSSLRYLKFKRVENLVTFTGKVRTSEEIDEATGDLGRLNEFFRYRNR
jgi:hypothetical protein